MVTGAHEAGERGTLCPKHGEPFIVPDCPDGFRRCTFYVPELGVSEDYGCPQPMAVSGRSEGSDG